MDQSYSESDISLSPTKIFERLQMLRQLQIMQRGKLQKQYQDSPEISSSVTEIVSHFSNSTSYNTFRSLLQSSQDIPHDSVDADNSCRKQIDQDYIEGVSVLNLSQESEFITNSPLSARSRISAHSRSPTTDKSNNSIPNNPSKSKAAPKNQISLDDMPILSPKKDFEELVIEKLQCENDLKNKSPKSKQKVPTHSKRPFLRRGEGMTRFGLQKNDLVIQNTKALPWRKSKSLGNPVKKIVRVKTPITNLDRTSKDVNVQLEVKEPEATPPPEHILEPNIVKEQSQSSTNGTKDKQESNYGQITSQNLVEADNNIPVFNTKGSSNKKTMITNQGSIKGSHHPLQSAKGQTWASVLTKEQDSFLRQLKQSDYYKNFVSPVKSIVSDSSCNNTLIKLRQDREAAEQNMFELLENKVSNESFNLNNSFFNRFLKRNKMECSGESTPLILQRCLYENPDLLHLQPEHSERKRNNSCSDGEFCSDYTDCSESCFSVSTCCSCKKDKPSSVNECHNQNNKVNTDGNHKVKETEQTKLRVNEKCQNDNAKTNDCVNAEMAEMNAKLIATSELLKERLKELEDEIETFRKENTNLTKMREELDMERQKFYEEKNTFEQKYNEEKILSEYYLAEEKEKLNKQKQIYDRYVREMRGRLSKKEKDEIINLKKEISELKEEIRNKDAKSTCTIARLRNQIKIMEKDKSSLQDEVEKLKKENRRIQHSNDITRRLTNLKYLEQINKKLTNMPSKNVHSAADLRNVKYKAFEIERQSRNRKIQPVPNTRRRAKSVPNLNVTSRYAKYFSQKDSISDRNANWKPQDLNTESDNEHQNSDKESFNEDLDDSDLINEGNSDIENNLEKIYNERFQSFSPSNSSRSKEILQKTSPTHTEKYNCGEGFFFQKCDSVKGSLLLSKSSLSPYQANSSVSSVNTSKSPVSILSQRSHCNSNSPINSDMNSEVNNVNGMRDNPHVSTRPKSPISILSNKSSASHRTITDVTKDIYSDKRMIPSPEPPSTRSSVSRTNLNPTEIRKLDGSRELRFPNGNVKHISADGKYSKFIYYNGDVKENFYDEGRIKYFYTETKTYHTTHADGLEVLEFSDGQVEKRYKDGSSEIRLPNGSVRYFDPKNEHVREEWRFPDGAALSVSATGEQRIVFSNGQVEVHAKDHKRREFPDGTVKLVYTDGTSETRYASGRVRIKDKHGNLIMDSAPG